MFQDKFLEGRDVWQRACVCVSVCVCLRLFNILEGTKSAWVGRGGGEERGGVRVINECYSYFCAGMDEVFFFFFFFFFVCGDAR